MNLLPRNCLSLLLSAVVLAGGVMPPGLRHAHSDADRPHQHHADEHHADHDSGHVHHGHHPHHSHQVEQDRETLPGHELHVHLRFFGFDLTIPDSSDSDSDRGTRLVDEAGTLVRFADDPLPDRGRAMDWFGELARSLFEAGLIDEIGLNVHPVLLGSGIPLFHTMGRQIDLELLECRPFENGCVLVKYRVKH